MTPSRSILLWLWLGLGLGVLSSATAEPAQQPTPESEAQASEVSETTAEAQAPEPQPPEPVALSEIPRRAEAANLRLREVEVGLSPERRVQAIASELPEWEAAFEEARQIASRRDAMDMSLRDLSDAENRWRGMEAQIEEWLTELESRTTELEAHLKEVRELARLWSLTEEAATADVPDALRNAIAGVLERAERVEGAAIERLGALLDLQNRLAEQALLVREELDELASVEAKARDSLLGRDRAPLWVALAREENRSRLARQAAESWSTTWRGSVDYIRRSPDRFAAQSLAFLALLWLFVQFHKKMRRLDETEGLEISLRALSHPVANAFLMTLLMTRLFHPRAPLGIFELNRLLLLLPLLTLLPGLLYASMKRPLYVLAGLYLVDLVVDIFPAQALLTRVLQLALSAVALVAVLRLTRPGGTAARLELGRWWRAAITGARIGAILLGLAVLANVFGRVRLSILLTDAMLTSAYAAVVLFAGSLVLQGLLTMLLRSRLSKSIRSVDGKAEELRRTGVKLVRLAAFSAWAAVTLRAVQLLDPFVDGARAVLEATLAVGELEVSIGDVLALALTIYLSVLLSRLARVLLEEDVLPQFSLPRGVPSAISMLAHYAILFLGFLFALAAAGIEASRFALLAGALGVGIGFGLQNIVNNFISGLVLLFERPIQVGDTIELEALFGKVSRIGIRSSTVRTFDGSEVIVPNSHLIDSRVVNWTLSDRLRRIEVLVGVAYGSRPRGVLDTLLEVAKNHEDVLDYPEPYALFEGFGDSSLDFILRAWTANFDDFLRIRSELKVGVHDALEAAGFVIPFPQRDLHVKSLPRGSDAATTDGGEDASVARDEGKREPAAPREGARARQPR